MDSGQVFTAAIGQSSCSGHPGVVASSRKRRQTRDFFGMAWRRDDIKIESVGQYFLVLWWYGFRKPHIRGQSRWIVQTKKWTDSME